MIFGLQPRPSPCLLVTRRPLPFGANVTAAGTCRCQCFKQSLHWISSRYMSAYTSDCSIAPSCLLSRHAQPNFITIDQILDDKNPGFAQLENCAEIGACVCV